MNLNIVIEVTRQCNLRCDHCLRGNAQNIGVNEKDVKTLFQTVKEINCLTLSGGEPALRPDKIQMIIDMAKKYEVDIQNFYLATNGTIASKEFLQSIFDLWCYCSDNEVSCVDISNDYFHDIDLIEENLQRFKAFSFVKYKHHPMINGQNYSENVQNFPDYFYTYEGESIIKEGRGFDFNGRENSSVTKEEFLEDPEDCTLYLNSYGDIILGCDWSYENQEDHKLCHVSELKEVLEEAEELEYESI